MKSSKSIRDQISKLLVNTGQATNRSTNGLLDRGDCLDLIIRLAAATEKLLALSEAIESERDELAARLSRTSFARRGSRGADLAGDGAVPSGVVPADLVS